MKGVNIFARLIQSGSNHPHFHLLFRSFEISLSIVYSSGRRRRNHRLMRAISRSRLLPAVHLPVVSHFEMQNEFASATVSINRARARRRGGGNEASARFAQNAKS